MTTVRLITEAEFTDQLLELAAIYGWETLHLRHAFSRGTYRVATQGTLGKGWPDLVLVRARDRRLIFAELKRDGGKLTDDQAHVLGILGELAGPDRGALETQVEVFTWRPSDFDAIQEALR